MTKTVGVLTWHAPESIEYATWPKRKNEKPVWGITALPHVAMRAKRVFSRIETSSTSTLYLTDGIGVAHEIEWFCQMFPLEMDADVRARLAQNASAHRERQSAIDDILGGASGHRVDLLMAPGMTPREYQSQFVDLLAQVHRLILGDATGVGKTITSALGFALPGALPALVAMPTNLPPQWTARMQQLWPMLTVHTLKGTRPYDFKDVRALKGHYPDILLTPYSRLAGWRYALAGQVRTVVFDEVQNLRTGRSSDKGKAAGHLSDLATYVVGASATPAHNYGTEFFDVLDIINPGALGTRAEFLREWGGGSYGGHEMIRDPKAFGTYLRESGLMLARTRQDVGREIPAPVVEVITVDSDSRAFTEVSDDIAAIAARIVDDATTNQDRFLLGGELDWKLRQATGVAKAPYVAQHVIDLLNNGEEKVLLVGWHRAVYETWLHALRPYGTVMYTGSESVKQKHNAVQEFLRPNDEGGSRVLIMSHASGAGLDELQKVCSVVVFGELDWSPKVHSQIIDRLNRDGQESTVLAQYLVIEDGSDPKVIEVLGLKSDNTDPVMDPDVALFEPVAVRNDADDSTPKGRVRDLAQSWLDRHPTSRKKAAA